MSKIVCEICGTTYEDTEGACPVCGWGDGGAVDLEAAETDMDEILSGDTVMDEVEEEEAPAVPPQKGKAVFDYDAVNTRRRPAPKAVPKPEPADDEDDEDEDEEEEESGSNKFLVIILVLLILALLAVSVYIGWTKILKPRMMGSEDNKPQETIIAETIDYATEDPEDFYTVEPATETTEPTVPCTELNLVAGMDKLTFSGQFWRLMVKASPENTTDKVVYTSNNEDVVTVDEYGRVTAVGEGETVIVITCGDQRLETPAVVSYAAEATEAATVAPVEGTSGTDTSGTTVATPSSGAVLKLKKTDITIGRRGVYVTLELENGITADMVKWSTSDASIATVWNGNVTALGRGTCVVTAEYNGQTAQCVVRCKF